MRKRTKGQQLHALEQAKHAAFTAGADSVRSKVARLEEQLERERHRLRLAELGRQDDVCRLTRARDEALAKLTEASRRAEDLQTRLRHMDSRLEERTLRMCGLEHEVAELDQKASTLELANRHLRDRVAVLEAQRAELLPWAKAGCLSIDDDVSFAHYHPDGRAVTEWPEDEEDDRRPVDVMLARIESGEFGEVAS